MARHEQQPNEQPAGSALKVWCRSAGISRPFYYTLPDEYRPRTVKLGDRRVVIEPARAWLERMSALGGVPTPRRAAK